ncbi:hypothetical protein GE21DRAFT_1056237 [Neurospora crassa]|nr:hypothetical protein GE21DRAFT_1056237 [Neurospora crassa]
MVTGRHGQHGSQNWGNMGEGALPQREDPGNNRDVANDTIKTVVPTRFPDLFPSNETRRWSYPCETDSLVLAECQGNADAPCSQNGKGWKPRGSKEEEARRRQYPSLRRACCTVMLHDKAYRPKRQRRRHPTTVTTTYKAKRGAQGMNRRDLTSPHASNNQQHFLKDTNTKLPAFTSHLLRQPKSLRNFGFCQISKL